jgi:hypothetical protein
MRVFAVLAFSSVHTTLAFQNGFLPLKLKEQRFVPLSSMRDEIEHGDTSKLPVGRRELFHMASSATVASLAASFYVRPALAVTPTGPGDGLLGELPPDGLRSYLQYRIALQIFADFFMYDLQRLVEDVDEWGEVGQLFRVNNNRGQGQPSRIERDFTNPVRILGLSFPPDVADPMVESQYKFERAMAIISKATAGYRRDLPVEVDKNAVKDAKAGWEDGRIAINEVFTILNKATGLSEMKLIPAAGPKQAEEYGRSSRRYFDLVKKTKLCQNRGGPALAQAWGGLMVSGYLQDSCGIPDLNEYFYQT